MESEGSDAEAMVPAHERIYLALRARILEGGMAPGETVTLRGLAEALGVSMTPVREAVRRLVSERALAIGRAGRVQVPDPAPGALEELFAVRRLLEPELARRALLRGAASRLARMRMIDAEIEGHLAAGTAVAFVRANNAFHATLYAAAQAPAMMALVESVWLQTAPAMRRVYDRVGTARLNDHHRAICAAVEAGDQAALCEAVRRDIEQSAALLDACPA